MKKLILFIALSVAFVSCKKEEIIVNEVHTTTNNYEVTNYVSAIPLYSVTIKNDTLTCDAEYLIYEYVRISETEFSQSRVYWKQQGYWTTPIDSVVSYYSENTLYINY